GAGPVPAGRRLCGAPDPLGAGVGRKLQGRPHQHRPGRRRRAPGGDRAGRLAAEGPAKRAGGMMKAAIDPVTLATPFFIATVILEIVLARFGALKAHYETKDTAISLTMGLVSSVAGLLTAGASFAAAVWIYQHRIFTIPMTAVWAWVLVFLLEDLTYYWFHRQED